MTGEISWIAVIEKTDYSVETPVGIGQEVVIIFFSANIHALAAKYAAKWVISEKSKVDFFINFPFNEF